VRFLTQDLGSGALDLVEGPAPALGRRQILVRTSASLVSAGTERMLVDFGRASLLNKARQQPEKVRQVVDKALTEGIGDTLDAVRSKLSQPIPLGYANAGLVVGVGEDVRDFVIGDLVATNGAHAELVAVPATLAAKVPSGVTAEEACFASVAAVGLQAIRLARAEIGERFVVTGLGLVGLLTAQLLLAQGCRVLGVDPDPNRRRLAESFGMTTAQPGDAELIAATFSGGMGVDGVLVCASTSSSDPMRAAARMCRQRGRVILVGVTGLDLERSELYEKEIAVQVSASYGPGRYDPSYEAGNDLPIGLVRWTAGRNMQAVIDLIATNDLDVTSLISHRVAFDQANDAYDTLVDDRQALGIVLQYGDTTGLPEKDAPSAVAEVRSCMPTPGASAVVGAGNYATRTLLPAIDAAGATVGFVVARSGASAQLAAEPAGACASTDFDAVLDDETVGAVFIATRHDSHAKLARHALDAGKAVYVEKPLVLSETDLAELAGDVTRLDGEGRLPVITVGFNRRWAPVTVRMRELLAATSAPRAIIITVNAGAIPAGHWTQDPSIGGGRILGEACHFIDLARHLAGHTITHVRTDWLGGIPTRDAATISLQFADGSTAHIHYLSNGSTRFPKERVEVICGGRVMVNENFRRLRLYGWPRRSALRSRRADKGHTAAVRAFLDAARVGGAPPIPWAEIHEVSRASIDAARG
jgi:predicted dehydrogenase/NADPH:quinone reductase-like Zn-dependent oxidoreductase